MKKKQKPKSEYSKVEYGRGYSLAKDYIKFIGWMISACKNRCEFGETFAIFHDNKDAQKFKKNFGF